jgi:hypothetical protein
MNYLNTTYLSRNISASSDRLISKRGILEQLKYYIIALLCLGFIFMSASNAQATHFRYGNISWKVVSSTPTEATVEFKVAMVFRSAYFGNPAVGTSIVPDLTFYHGDGTSRSILLLVTSQSVSEGWFYGEATFTKIYANPNGTYNAYFNSCCRISTLQNNRDATYQVETLVNLGAGNTSPVSTLPPIINLPLGVASAAFTIPASDPDGDQLTFSLTPSSQMGSGSSNPVGFSIDAATGVATFNTVGRSVNQLYNASVTISDGKGARIAVDFLMKITTASNPPVFVNPTPESGSVLTVELGNTLNFNVKAEDPDAADIVTLQVVGLPPTATMTPALPTSGAAGEPVQSSFAWTPSGLGTFIVNFTAEDNNGAQSTSSVTIRVVASVCNISLSGTSANETCEGGSNGTIILTATGGVAPLQYSIDNGITFQASNEFTGVSADAYTALVKDANGCTGKTIVEVIQHNDLPSIASVSGPTEPASVSTASISMNASVTDDNLVSATWTWGDGTANTEINPGSEITGTHTYSQAGVYLISLTITDICGETASATYEYVVVYDPSGGFVTGGGWIHSPAGAYIEDVTAEGKANFGFVSKYKKGAHVPDGQTQFQFHAVKFNFHSTSYEWLVVAGHKAQYKGEGKLNGVGGYGFMLSVVDGDKKSSTEPDKFRIKIWDKSNGAVVYDSQLGASDDAEASLSISGGNIVIHDGGKKSSSTVSEGLAELTTGGYFSAYPNPLSQEGLWLDFHAIESAQSFEASVYDISGRLVAKQVFEVDKQGGKHLWNIGSSQWSNGVYILVVKGNEGVQRLRLVK